MMRFVLGAGDLDQAQLRPEGLLANELRVDGHERVLGRRVQIWARSCVVVMRLHGRGVIAQPFGIVATNAPKRARA